MYKKKLLEYLTSKQKEQGELVAEHHSGGDNVGILVPAAKWGVYNDIISRIENGEFD